MTNTIAETMYNILLSENKTCVWYGDIDIIERCAIKCKIRKTHPTKTISCVLNALERSPKFKKTYIQADFNGYKRKYRCFNIL